MTLDLPTRVTFAQTPMEILSKENTRAIFAMSRDQWERNSAGIIALGKAKPWPGRPPEVSGIIIEQPGGMSVWTRPLYENASRVRPMAVQVNVGYRQPLASALVDSVLREAVIEAQRQHAPEYDVYGNVERSREGVGIFFMISERVPIKP